MSPLFLAFSLVCCWNSSSPKRAARCGVFVSGARILKGTFCDRPPHSCTGSVRFTGHRDREHARPLETASYYCHWSSFTDHAPGVKGPHGGQVRHQRYRSIDSKLWSFQQAPTGVCTCPQVTARGPPATLKLLFVYRKLHSSQTLHMPYYCNHISLYTQLNRKVCYKVIFCKMGRLRFHGSWQTKAAVWRYENELMTNFHHHQQLFCLMLWGVGRHWVSSHTMQYSWSCIVCKNVTSVIERVQKKEGFKGPVTWTEEPRRVRMK